MSGNLINIPFGAMAKKKAVSGDLLTLNRGPLVGSYSSNQYTISNVTTTAPTLLLVVASQSVGADLTSATLSSSGAMTRDQETSRTGGWRHNWFRFDGTVSGEDITVAVSSAPGSNDTVYALFECSLTGMTYDASSAETTTATGIPVGISAAPGARLIVGSLAALSAVTSGGDYTVLYQDQSLLGQQWSFGYSATQPVTGFSVSSALLSYFHELSWT